MQQESLKIWRVPLRWRRNEEENGMDQETTERVFPFSFMKLALSFLLHLSPEQWDTFPAAITYSWGKDSGKQESAAAVKHRRPEKQRFRNNAANA